jgi:ABC-type multidrug transport system ATPase subunit
VRSKRGREDHSHEDPCHAAGPDEGSVGFAGIDLLENKMDARRFLGYLPQDFGLYPDFTAEQMLTYLAKLKGVFDGDSRELIVEALLDRVNLNSARDQKLGTFSGGMRQRFGIAQALLGNRKLIIVDEPTAGLDPVERSAFYNLLAEVAEDVVVILSTHIVADVSSLCSQMAHNQPCNRRINNCLVYSEPHRRTLQSVVVSLVDLRGVEWLLTQFGVAADA